MGIKGLSQVIADNCPSAVRHNDIKNYFGRKVAIDASMSLYQFLIQVRGQDGQQLMNDQGETTSHLMGMFYRTLRMVDNGLKPCYVFDGKPPTLKSGELAKRASRQQKAREEREEAKEVGTAEMVDKFAKRTVRVTRQHNDEAKKLLELMGIPYVNAPCEAEAQCAALARAGKVYAAASEDMDTMCFQAPILLRHLTFSEQRKEPISEYSFEKTIEGLNFTIEQFVDLCILLGCDYCDPIRGVGPARAVELIRQHGNLDNFVKDADKKKFPIPEDWPYQDARRLFLEAEVQEAKDIELKWRAPDEQGIIKFLVEEKGFNEDRVRVGINRLVKASKTIPQGRLDSFFKVLPSTKKEKEKPKAAAKRKRDTKSSAPKKKR
ncbi:FEN-1 endonuclease [Schizosaccharomyces japonicus yFS275]|uniref:Flap endonuclease 1 n=1 Tax=Schizosaccharomyces japonicus (strain yFS275 / FY16936) TaxID=402676 RepID=FEN1_SCHJY|nr:FEN-1 endonuclease [Schizosaccharomyces japonicus yFS275]B6JYI7.1 RecName: Full=Flap endonuclease 1; Short=FEN-1; AltName: Full=Flap structure-specific endonuclease 1 [Schizosaccharomyces japonicus yFS275]EEB06605.1 FEN-1 endonuclease [Schizosaccharomyces japonicus yFS275]